MACNPQPPAAALFLRRHRARSKAPLRLAKPPAPVQFRAWPPITIPLRLKFYAAAALRLMLGSGRRERSPMIDFYPMVLAALSKLDRNTEDTRQALYQRARTALAGRRRR